MDAEFEEVKGLPVEDPDDACTVFEVNYMSNVAPQSGSDFNEGKGSWYKLETEVRKAIKYNSKTFHLIAGPVFRDDPIQRIGPHSDIQVPHSFFKIVVHAGNPVGFLFAHDKQVPQFGCSLKSEPEECIVSIDKIELATGLDFFNHLSIEEQHRLESKPNKEYWKNIKGDKKGQKKTVAETCRSTALVD